MGSQADLRDSRVLERLLEVLDRLARPLEEVASEAKRDAGPRMRRLEEAIGSGRDRVDAAERALAVADEESFGSCEDGVEEARAQLRELEEAADDVREAAGRYRTASRDLRAMQRQELPAASKFLREQIDAVHAYTSFHVRSGEVGRGLARGGMSDSDAAAHIATPALPPLPSGYQWIPLNRIIIPDEDRLEFKKVDRNVIETGMQAFSRDILPSLNHAGFSRDYLASLDQAVGRCNGGIVHSESLANLYDIFFGSDPIAASPTTSGTLDLSSGRHRAAVARGLGWTHVPGRMLGGSQ